MNMIMNAGRFMIMDTMPKNNLTKSRNEEKGEKKGQI